MRERVNIQHAMKGYRQYGVAIPRGAEAAVHFGDVVEHAAFEGKIDPVVAIDVDLANCVCTLEWDTMREDVQKITPELVPWLSWQQSAAGQIVLPGGDERNVDRGAEQGEPLGSTATAACIGAASHNVHASFNADSFDGN